MNRRSILGVSAITVLGLAVIPGGAIAQQRMPQRATYHHANAGKTAGARALGQASRRPSIPAVRFRWFATPCRAR